MTVNVFDLSKLVEQGGFEKWTQFHDCLVADALLTDTTILLKIEGLYDWDSQKYTGCLAVLILRCADVKTLDIDRDRLFDYIHRLELDIDGCTVHVTLTGHSFTVFVDPKNSFLMLFDLPQ
jgi:hypothetical protein